MNVAFFIHTMGRGGAEMALVNLANSLSEQGQKVTLYPILNTGDLSKKLSNDVDFKPIFNLPNFIKKRNVNKTGTLIKGNDGLSLTSKLYAVLWRIFHKQISLVGSRKVGRHDVYISYLEGPTCKFVADLRTNERKIAWVHVDLSREKKSEIFFKNIEENRKNFDCFDDVVAVSTDVKRSLQEYLKINNDIHVIYNIYNVSEIISKSRLPLSDRKRDKLYDDKINIISVGRLTPQKGYDRLVSAISQIKKSNVDLYSKLNIIIVGDGEQEDSLLDLMNDYDVTDAIHLFGFTSNPYNFIAQSDVFISSSRTEGFSTVAVEATILGKYIVTTDCSGMKEILISKTQGCIFENSTQGIVESLEHIGQNIESIKSSSVDNNIEAYMNSLDDHLQLLLSHKESIKPQ
uniref:Glycosyltransferase n=1 Tax=Erysipelothrix rhusiopathiae TaxID=1648 RepID=A0A6S6I1G4_ERYRH|nr:glycosyltransferase [Erysipelothrix rhusiopathiae]